VGLATRYYFLSECCCLKFAVLFLWGALSDERKGSAISSVIAQWSEPHGTRNHTLLSHLRPQPGGSGSHIYILQEQGGPDIPPGTGFSILLPLVMQDVSKKALQWFFQMLVCGEYCQLSNPS
jgi:hypothetical protein